MLGVRNHNNSSETVEKLHKAMYSTKSRIMILLHLLLYAKLGEIYFWEESLSLYMFYYLLACLTGIFMGFLKMVGWLVRNYLTFMITWTIFIGCVDVDSNT